MSDSVERYALSVFDNLGLNAKLDKAEQRIAALEALLREAANVIDNLKDRYNQQAPAYIEAEELIGRIAEALQGERK